MLSEAIHTYPFLYGLECTDDTTLYGLECTDDTTLYGLFK